MKIKVTFLAILTGCCLYSAAIICNRQSKTQILNAAPLRLVTSEEADRMSVTRAAGLSGDSTQVPAVINSLKNFAQLHPLATETALHTLAQFGARDALPTIDSVIQREVIPDVVTYAKVARARLVAESSSKALDGTARASAKINTFYSELGLTSSDLNSDAARLKQMREEHQSFYPPMGVYAMREIADMVYLGSYADYANLPGVKQVDFGLDYPSQLKVRLAPLTRAERVQTLIHGLAERALRGPNESYDMQLVTDEGVLGSSVAAAQLQDMDTSRGRYPKEGFDMMLSVLSSTGDRQQAPVVAHFRQDADPEVAEFARIKYYIVQNGHKISFAPGY